MCATDLVLPPQNILEEPGRLKRQLEQRVIADARSQLGCWRARPARATHRLTRPSRPLASEGFRAFNSKPSQK